MCMMLKWVEWEHHIHLSSKRQCVNVKKLKRMLMTR